MKHTDFTGWKFTRWTALCRAENDSRGMAQWFCVCECGTFRVVKEIYLRYKDTKSCGCLSLEALLARSVKHGHSRVKGTSSTYSTWRAMMTRCYNPQVRSYVDYGGRGIIVCERWHDFRNFLADLGEKPPGLTLDRKSNEGNYEPSNCHWATNKQQARNTRKNRFLTYNGETRCLSEWAEHFNIPYMALFHRLKKGWTLEEAFTKPFVSERTHWKRNSLTFNGKTMRLTQWAKELGLTHGTIGSRLRLGWSVEKALSTPSRKQKLI